MKRILFVCMGCEQRSPTFRDWFIKNRPRYEVKAAGTNPINSDLSIKANPSSTIEWADVIFCMDIEQTRWLWENYPNCRCKLNTIGICDDYSRNDKRLLNLIEFWTVTNKL